MIDKNIQNLLSASKPTVVSIDTNHNDVLKKATVNEAVRAINRLAATKNSHVYIIYAAYK